MASTLDLGPYLKAWIAARCPSLSGKVHPLGAKAGSAGPYATYFKVSGHQVDSLAGFAGTGVQRIQIDVWSQSRDQTVALADRICGTDEDPGLGSFTGELGSSPSAVFVQSSRYKDGFDDYSEPENGGEVGWFRTSGDYEIWFETTLRSD